MHQRLIELHTERGRLLERIAHQRTQLSGHLAPAARVLHLGDRAAAVARECRRFAATHPLAVAVGIGTLVLLRPRGALRWAGRGLLLWRSWRTVRSFVTALTQD